MIEDHEIIVTGGAGFIGRYIAEELNSENEVQIIDKEPVPEWVTSDMEYSQQDISKKSSFNDIGRSDMVIHLAGFSDVQESISNTRKSYKDNLQTTISVIEYVVENDIDNLVYTSTSAVYGEELNLPVTEDHPREPVSDYGASKLAGENLIRMRSKIDNFDYHIFRLGNIVGLNGHGVVQDFVRKVRQDPSQLKILGNGRQEKSYLHVSECIRGIIEATEHCDSGAYNLSSTDTVSVDKIADIVCDVLNQNPDYTYTGGDKGWVGDVPRYKLDVSKVHDESDWKSIYDSEESIRKTVTEIVEKNEN